MSANMKPKPPPPMEYTPPPTATDPEVERKKQEELRKLRMMKGRRSTLLTGGLGLTNSAPTRKTLLGG